MRLEIATLAVIVVFFAAFAIVSLNGEHEWGGADGQAENVVAELTGGTYQPWFKSIWEPPSGEIESLLFSLQAAIGSIIIGYFLGYYRAMAKMTKKAEQEGREEGRDAHPAR